MSKPWLRLLVPSLFLLIGFTLLACSSDDPPPAEQPQAVSQEAEQSAEAQPEAEQEEPEPQIREQSTQQDADPAPSPQQQTQEQAASDSADVSRAEPQQEAQEQPQPQQQQVVSGQQEQAMQPERTLEGVRGIVDPNNLGWPREVEGLSGVVSIPAKPTRIITASIGHDEVVLALVPAERLVAVGAVSKDPTFSNMADLVLDKPEVSRDPETIIVQSPDIVVTSPWYPVEGIDALRRAGILVIQTALDLDPQAQIDNILLIGYMLGEEERALAFADEVQGRYQAVLDATSDKSPRPSVISLTQYGDSLWTAGSGTTQGSLIVAAGGVNAAAEHDVEGNQTIGLEAVIAMAPDVIIIPQPAAYGAEEFRQSLFNEEALSEVPAIQNETVYIVESKHFTTLSYWNIRGAEDLARILWPEDFPDPPDPAFSLAE